MRLSIFNLLHTFRVLNGLGISLRVRIRLGGGRDCYPAFWVSLFDCDLRVAELYAKLYGGRQVPISETPHVEFLTSHNKGVRTSSYRDYRAVKLPAGIPDSMALERRYLDLVEEVRAQRIETVIQVHARKGDSIPTIIDGLHRAAIAYALDSKTTVRCICPLVWLTLEGLGPNSE